MNWRSIRLKWFNREYWPIYLVYSPIFFYWLWLSLRAGSLLFFTASNPAIKNGGMFGESKKEILDLLPEELIPNTMLFKPGSDPQAVLQKVTEAKFNFPLIAKPDIGERGKGVNRLDSGESLARYVEECKADFLIQEYIDLPLETGIFYIRMPGSQEGMITSITLKEMLSITGNGISTIEELVSESDRAFLVKNELQEKWAHKWHMVPATGEEITLQNIGNHCRGTKFLNGASLKSDKLTAVFDRIAAKIPGFCYGRFDIRASSTDHLIQGDFKILELNGAKSEPSHIYDPELSLSEAYKSLFWHWKMLYNVSVSNHKQGVAYLTFRNGWQEFRRFLQHQDLIPGSQIGSSPAGAEHR